MKKILFSVLSIIAVISLFSLSAFASADEGSEALGVYDYDSTESAADGDEYSNPTEELYSLIIENSISSPSRLTTNSAAVPFSPRSLSSAVVYPISATLSFFSPIPT